MHIDFSKTKWQNKIIIQRKNEKISANHIVYGRRIIVRTSKRLRIVIRRDLT